MEHMNTVDCTEAANLNNNYAEILNGSILEEEEMDKNPYKKTLVRIEGKKSLNLK